MPTFAPASPRLDDHAINAQRAAFVAALADSGDLGRLWGNHTTGIMGFAKTLGDYGDEYDSETRREFCVIMETQAEWLRLMNDQIQMAAMFLSGVSVPRYIRQVDLAPVMERATSYQWTYWHGEAPEVMWNEVDSIITTSESHAFIMLSALVRQGLYLAQNGLRVSVERDSENIHFVFSGDTEPAHFTDSDGWFMINPERGTESIQRFLARKLSQIYGGHIWVESANKTRFDFRLSLPVTQEVTDD